MKIAFDVGGVLSKYPHILKPWIGNMECGMSGDTGIEVFVISDMHPKEKIIDMLKSNGFGDVLKEENIYSADYKTHGEKCKAVLCKELNIDILVDDFMGYVTDVDGAKIRLLVMPNTNEPYYHDSWKTDGSEGDFGRRTVPNITNLKVENWSENIKGIYVDVEPQKYHDLNTNIPYALHPVPCKLTLVFEHIKYELVGYDIPHSTVYQILHMDGKDLSRIAVWESEESKEGQILRGVLCINNHTFYVERISGSGRTAGESA